MVSLLLLRLMLLLLLARRMLRMLLMLLMRLMTPLLLLLILHHGLWPRRPPLHFLGRLDQLRMGAQERAAAAVPCCSSTTGFGLTDSRCTSLEMTLRQASRLARCRLILTKRGQDEKLGNRSAMVRGSARSLGLHHAVPDAP